MKNSRQFVPAPHKNKRTRLIVLFAALVIIFAVPVIRRGLRSGVDSVGISIARGAHSAFFGVANIGADLRSKTALMNENTALESQIAEMNARLLSESMIASENADLRAAMGRTDTLHFTLVAVIAKPPHSVYDTLIIDGGSKVGLSTGETAYANGETPIGTISEVSASSAVVKLYSAPGETTDARLSPLNIDLELTGLGGGDFSATIPHDLVVPAGAAAVTKEIDPSVIAVYQKVTSDARDPFQTLLLSAPINVNELSFVEVAQQQ